MKRKYHRTGAIILSIFIAAIICIIAVVIIIYQSGLRYMKTADTGIKYFGSVDKSGNIANGSMWFEDTVASIGLQKFYTVEIKDKNLAGQLKILNLTPADDVLKIINDTLPKEMTDYFPMNNFIFNTSDDRIMFHKEDFGTLIKNYQSDKNNIKYGEIHTSDGKVWILVATKTNTSSYVDFDVSQQDDKSKVYKGDVLQFVNSEQITFATFTLASGNIINLYPAYDIYRIYYEKGGHAEDLYIGAINSNIQKDGKGLYYYKSGDIYYGDFAADEKTGKCEFLFAQGDSYVGNILNGQKEGDGVFTWSDGTSYTGSFKNNMKNGHGVNVFADGSVYDGNYVNDVKQGEGKYAWANGDVYEGNFENDSYNGTGKYTWASGEYYEGDFMHNTMHGWGTYYWTSGRTYSGWFDNGKMVLEKPADVPDTTDTSNSADTTGMANIPDTTEVPDTTVAVPGN
ncbi:MAG: hypothetical protein FWD71_00700 [Oscillospiraceae bacterium]|nr:hypothetical protein [Oscillospiraceae bacterium]